MIDLFINNATIVTSNAKHDVITKGGLGVNEGRITEITKDGQTLEAKQVIDANGQIVMPGLINVHCHAPSSLFRGLVENLTLEKWLEQVWIAEKAILNEESCELGAYLGLAENLRAGVTTVVDMFWYPWAAVRASRKLGMRLAAGPTFFDLEGVGGRSHEDYVAEGKKFVEEFGGSDDVYATMMPHGAYTVSPEHLQESWQIAHDNNALYHIHCAETKTEREDITNRYGQSVIRHLDHLGLLDERTFLAHCVHVDDEEIEILVKTKAGVAHNPLSNLKLGSGFSPIEKMLDAGALVGIGTDGAVSGNDLDMWLAMRLAATLPKGKNMRADIVSPEQVLHMATINGAKILNQQENIGSLEVGKQADFVVLDTEVLHALPIFDPISHLVFSAGRADVKDVYIGGQQRVKDGKVVGLDFADLSEKVKQLQVPMLEALGRN